MFRRTASFTKPKAKGALDHGSRHLSSDMRSPFHADDMTSCRTGALDARRRISTRKVKTLRLGLSNTTASSLMMVASCSSSSYIRSWKRPLRSGAHFMMSRPFTPRRKSICPWVHVDLWCETIFRQLCSTDSESGLARWVFS
jgi:hypothetical protein